MSDDFRPIRLDNVHGCISELQACSNGLAAFDHLYAQALDNVSECEAIWEAEEAKAAKAARENAPKAATATEIKAGITEYVNDRPSARQALDNLRAARNTLKKIERDMRSLEKRGSHAQAARNGHEQIQRGGGNGSGPRAVAA